MPARARGRSTHWAATACGRAADAAERLQADARRLADAGCFGIVLELVPAALAAEVTRAVLVPTMG